MAGQIIINEFVAFIQNKIDILDEVSIVQICASNYTDVEIEDGKRALYSACNDCGVRNIQRKGEDKKKKNIKDVIKLLKEVEPDVQPIFVAKDLNRLPPVSFDYVDVTRLLKDMAMMRTELTELKTKFSLELSDFRTSLNSHIERGVKHTPQIMTTPKSKKSITPPVPLPLVKAPRPALGHEEVALSLHTPTYRDIVHGKNSSRQTKGARMLGNNSGGVRKAADRSVVLDVPPESVGISKNYTDDDFIIVENKKRKRKLTNMRGTYSEQCKIQVADPECSIYISRALKTVTEANIKEHIHDMGQECLGVERLTQHKETSFNSFKVKIHGSYT